MLLSSFSIVMAQNAPSQRSAIIPDGSEIGQQLILPQTNPGNNPEEYYLGGTLLPNITRTVITASGATAVLFVIIGGIQILTAYGSEEKIGKAKKTITWALVGLLIAILAYAMVSIISAINLNQTTTK